MSRTKISIPVPDELAEQLPADPEEQQQVLILEVPNDLPQVVADLNRAEQVLTNLLSNAYKYTPEKGAITLRVTVERGPLPAVGAACHHPRPSGRPGSLGGAVAAAVVDDDQLVLLARGVEVLAHADQARGEAIRLVVGGDHEAEHG